MQPSAVSRGPWLSLESLVSLMYQVGSLFVCPTSRLLVLAEPGSGVGGGRLWLEGRRGSSPWYSALSQGLSGLALSPIGLPCAIP